MKNYTTHDISNEIKAEAQRLGFSACGIAKAEPVDSHTAAKYRQWLHDGKHASMQYLENNLDKRLDPTLLMPNVKSIICLALNYYPKQLLTQQQYQFAYYAYGKDYHDVMKQKMQSLAVFMQSLFPSYSFKLCCDTVPILDRYWASRAGLGWIGKNGNLIIPNAGSYFFLGEILVDIELGYDTSTENRCGACQKCIAACPTKALSAPYCVDARKCLSYLTIEHRGEFDETCKRIVGRALDNTVYGCDCCQKACPWNRFAQPTKIQEFAPSDKFLSMSPTDWENLTIEDYRTLFKGSAVKRVKYEGLMRNIANLRKNDDDNQ
ncbi:MAG: tRNA epoxyqueuosine(34) reductase QueG [Prevotellaceae bacterium]|nr:tRNA epoxyqueuosine(34) reductase QueG [Prevotellaceae bacterium]